MRRRGMVLGLLLFLAGCSSAPEREAPGPGAHPSLPAPPAGITFVNRVWAVTDSSSVPAGALYVFVSDGTLLVTSPHGTPAVGSWRRDAQGLVVVEEGRPYPATILRLTGDAFWLRLTNPGEPTILRFATADTAANAAAGAAP